MEESSDTLQHKPRGWRSEHSPMTDAQRVSLDILAAAAGESTPGDSLSLAEASVRIKQLRREIGIHDDDDSDTELDDDDD
ncbi:MAG: DUF3072 domain-containing protein [Candidatus Saccharibacteria bacterium]